MVLLKSHSLPFSIRRPLAVFLLMLVGFIRFLLLLWPYHVQLPALEERQTLRCQGVVTEVLLPPQETDSVGSVQLYLKHVELAEESGETVSNQVLVTLLPGQKIPPPGRTVTVQGEVRFFSHATNPGEYDSADYYFSKGISFQIAKAEILEVSSRGNLFAETMWKIKNRLGDGLSFMLPDDQASVARAMLLGEKRGMDKELKELYAQAGIAHVTAVAGLHITLLIMVAYKLLRKWLSLPAAAIGASILLVCYLGMIGWSLSALRAAVMFFLQVGADLCGRTADSVTSLAVAAGLLLLENPAALGQIGFRLSFSAAAGALLALPAFERMIETKEWILHLRYGQYSGHWYRESGGIHRLTDGIRQAFRAGFCITLFSLPVYLSSYYEWNVLSILINVLVVPLMSVLLFGILLLAVIGAIRNGFLANAAGSEVFCRCISAPVRAILWLYEICCRGSLALPFGRIRCGAPALWQVVIYYGVLVFMFFGAGHVPRAAGYLAVLTASMIFLLPARRGGELTMLDVGQGECVCFRTTEGQFFLSDCGSTSKSDTGTWQVIPFLKEEGINRLELIFVSHPDEDHYNGLRALFEWEEEGGVSIGGVVISVPDKNSEDAWNPVLSAAAQAQVPVYRMQAGEELVYGHTRIRALHPMSGEQIESSNQSSLVLHIWDGRNGLRVLLTGDLEAVCEGDLAEKLEKTESTYQKLTEEDSSLRWGPLLLKIAHHGSATSTSESFLERISAAAALISVGKNNSYGHPHAEILERLEDRRIPVLRTDEMGAIRIRRTGDKLTAEPCSRALAK